MWQRLLRLGLIFVLAITLFLALILAAFALPQAPISAHIAASVPQLKAERSGYSPMFPSGAFVVDTFTDSLMLDTALRMDHGLLDVAVAGYHGSVETDPDWADPIKALSYSVSGQRLDEVSYARYWHGYQVFLRPMLIFFDYGEIRYVNVLLLGGLLVALGMVLSRKLGATTTSLFFLSLLLASFYIVPFSISLSNMVYLTMVACIVVSLIADRPWFPSVDMELFLVAGMLTSFLDLLTAPLLTLGLPLALALTIMMRRGGASARNMWGFAFRMSAIWSLGYLGSWFIKWVIASIVMGSDQIGVAIGVLLFRTGAGTGGSQVLGALSKNVQNLFPLLPGYLQSGSFLKFALNPIFIGSCAFVGVLLWLLVFCRRAQPDGTATVYLFLMALPYAWYVVVNNHSDIHAYMTFRIQAISVFATLMFLSGLIDFDKVKNRIMSTRLARRTDSFRE